MKIMVSRSSASVRLKPSCSNCRSRHLKCDASKGECGPCRLRNLACEREDFSPIMYQHKSLKHDRSDDCYSDQVLVFPLSEELLLLKDGHISSKSPEELGQDMSEMSTSPGEFLEPPTMGSNSSDDGESCELPSCQPGLLTSRRHAVLFNHFVSSLSAWFDVTSKNDEFRKQIPGRALHCRVLLFAILAVSSKHRSLVDHSSGHEAEQLYDECLKLLITKFNEPNVQFDEDVFAAVVILRLYEELSSTAAPLDADCHLISIRLFAQNFSGHSHDDIGSAAFRVQLRQDLCSSIICSRPLKLQYIPLAAIEVLRGDDYLLANEICCIAANIANHCFGPKKNEINVYREAKENVSKWYALCCDKFQSIYAENEGTFPITCYEQPFHAVAMECYHLANILLAVFAPQLFVPMEASSVLIHKMVEKSITSSLRKVMGIALGTDNDVVRIMVCPVLWIAGPLCTASCERTSIVEFLIYTEERHHWPTKNIVDKLKREWNQYDLL